MKYILVVLIFLVNYLYANPMSALGEMRGDNGSYGGLVIVFIVLFIIAIIYARIILPMYERFKKFITDTQVDTHTKNGALSLVDIDEEKETELHNWGYVKKSIEHLKNNEHPSVKLKVNDIGIIINAVNRIGLRQGLCEIDIGNETYEKFICFEYYNNNYCIYELNDEIGLADLSKIKTVGNILWVDEI